MNCQSWFYISGHQYFQVHDYKVSQDVTPANEILIPLTIGSTLNRVCWTGMNFILTGEIGASLVVQ